MRAWESWNREESYAVVDGMERWPEVTRIEWPLVTLTPRPSSRIVSVLSRRRRCDSENAARSSRTRRARVLSGRCARRPGPPWSRARLYRSRLKPRACRQPTADVDPPRERPALSRLPARPSWLTAYAWRHGRRDDVLAFGPLRSAGQPDRPRDHEVRFTRRTRRPASPRSWTPRSRRASTSSTPPTCTAARSRPTWRRATASRRRSSAGG